MRIGTILRNAAANGMLSALAGSRLRAYTGERPTALDGSVAGDTLLSEHVLGSPAFDDSVAGVLTALAIDEVEGIDDGVIGWVRWVAANGTDILADLTAGVGTGEVRYNTLTVSEGVASRVTSMAITVPAGS